MQKLKKPVSILLVFMMIVSLFAAVPMTVNAAPPGGSEPGPGGTEIGTGTVITPTAEHEHDNITFEKWESTTSLPTTAGNYYLADDVTLSAAWSVPAGETKLCLDGHQIRADVNCTYGLIQIQNGIVLNLYDKADNSGIIGHNSGKSGRGIYVGAGGTLNMYGGTIRDNTTGSGAAGVMLYGTFNMYGGSIQDNSAREGGGMQLLSGSAIFNMYGGTIKNNRASKDGGGVLIMAGTFTLKGGNIEGNVANNGGGVSITAGTFTLKGGNIEGNVANNGGGVSVNGSSSFFTMAGGTIRYNSGYGNTGGVLLMSTDNFTMTGGEICSNVGKNFGGIGIANAHPKMSGTAVVKDNVLFSDVSQTNTKITKNDSGYTLASGGTPCDIKDATANSLLINVTGAFESGAQIGIFNNNQTAEFTSGFDANNPGGAPADYFFSNDSNRFVMLSENKEAQLGRYFTVTWKNENGTDIDTTTVAEGEIPTHADPTKPDDAQHTYAFTGWTPAITAATANATYTATFAPCVASVTSNDTTTKYTDFGTAVSNWTDGSTLTLLADVTMNGTITISGTRTLDLNGYGITKSDQGRLFNVDGNLTINDSNPTRSTHKYTVDGTGLAVLDENGTQSFQGGYITGGYGYADSGATGWGGFALVDMDRKGNCSLTINGGTIIGNKTEIGGGGVVRLNGNSTFTMNGGAIIYNTTAYLTQSQVNDGAVSGEENVTFYIGGGTIAHNTTKGGVTSDLYLANNQKVIVDGELDSATSIGIKMQNGTGVFTNSIDSALNDASKFFSDDSNYGVFKNTDGQLELKTAYTVTWKNGDTVLKTEKVAKDTIPQYTGETPTKADDAENTYTFSGWSDGTKTYGTTETLPAVTGDTTYTAQFTEKPKTLIAGHSLSLDGNIGINFYLDPSVAGLTAQQVSGDNLSYTFTWADVETTKAKVNVAEQANQKNFSIETINGVDYIKVTCYVCAAEMTCGVNATFTLNGKTESESEPYTVRKYCDDSVLSENAQYKDDTKLVELVKAMLNYGAMAQTKFKVNTGYLANQNVTYEKGDVTGTMIDAAIAAANGTETADDMNEVATALGAKWYSTSLIYLDDSTLRHYFVKDTEAFNPSAYTYNKSNYYYYVEVPGIAAAELDNLQTFNVGNDSFQYSALDFVKGMINSSADVDSKNLAKALYWYNQAANEYFPAPAPVENVVDLSTLTGAYEAQNGDVLTGALQGDYKITIADGATITLRDANITCLSYNAKCAGITPLGDATIMLEGENTVKGSYSYPGVYSAEGATLTIDGTGLLDASSNGSASGIGGGEYQAAGNIVINGGTITASGDWAAGIGSGYGYDKSCGNITITGGTITAYGDTNAPGIGGGYYGRCQSINITGGTVTAIGGSTAAGIGSGSSGNCGNITIANTVKKVTAEAGGGSPNSIGAGYKGSCGTVTIGGKEGAISTSPYTYQP